MSVVISHTRPESFTEEICGAIVYIECQGDFLYLRKAPEEKLAGKWGVPGGKIEPGEDVAQAAIREVKEETDISLPNSKIIFLKPMYFQTKELSFTLNLHLISLKERPDVRLSNEHDCYLWANRKEIFELDLMIGGIEPFLEAERYLLK